MCRRAQLPNVYLPEGKTIYVCRFTAHGKRHHVTTGCSDRGEAEQKACRIHAEAQLGRLRPPAPRRSVLSSEAPLSKHAARWLAEVEANKAKWTAKGYRSCYERSIAVKWQYLSQIDTNTIAAFITQRSGQVKSPTVNRELVALSRFLHWCKREHLISEVPTFERPRSVSDYVPPDLSREEVHRVLAALPTAKTHPKRYPAREFYTVLWGLGLRVGELIGLDA